MSLLSLALFRRAVARFQHRVLYSVERQRVLQPQPELMATKAMVRRAVHAPLAQDVACCCRAQLHAQRPVLHHVVHRGDLWVWLVRTRGCLIRVITKSRNSCDFRSKARTCHLRPLSISANGTTWRSAWPLEMEWYSIVSGHSWWIARVTLASTSRSG